MKGKRFVVFALGLLILTGYMGASTVSAQAGAEDVSAPNKVPDMSGFRTKPDSIEPGKTGTFNFTLTNRYQNNIENATLLVEIYKWATIDEAKDIGKITRAPFIRDGQGQSYRQNTATLLPGEAIDVSFRLGTKDDTPEGTYFLRTSMEFDYQGQHLVMKSRGHFTNEQWKAATDDVNLNQSVGGINITYLGVDGILVDSSFSVKSPTPMWPLAILILLIIIFGVLAVVFYLVEEEKGHNRLKKMFFPTAGKVKQKKKLLKKDLEKRRREGKLKRANKNGK
jgi:hypothetical protein